MSRLDQRQIKEAREHIAKALDIVAADPGAWNGEDPLLAEARANLCKVDSKLRALER